ncbi:MAG: endonuclease MutS2 [Aquificaceae bacterium]|nr:endonuclease MutS2 [Aquificaceae bacterium]MCS7195814.1 endonuclease MutS2 [Aquificaceae bacterium]MDW8032656.1 endonuclease MutS2 [Aquificaceae bacterium]MDW8293762.1 endonuclease MutS2 [Aquificaceae bacterium]
MRERDLIKLEFFQVLDRIKVHAHSKATERFIEALRPITDRQKLEENLQLFEDFMKVSDRITLYPFEDVEELIKRTSIRDFVISVEEALTLLKVIRLIRELRKSLGEMVQNYRSLAQLTKGLYLFNFLENAIESLIDPRGFVKDSASEELRDIRNRIRETEKEVLKRLEALFSRPDADKVFSDKFVAYKNSRYVLPVKTSEVRKIVGVVHGTSSSGFTTYVEPQSAIELNNRLVALREEEEEEVRRVLRKLASLIGEQSGKLLEAFRTLVRIDALWAVGKFAEECGGKFPKIGDHVELLGVRHPLLLFLKEDTVGVDIVIKGRKGLLLTGPNTGGKTVALKTLGLCSLMFQSGIPIPAEEATLPIFGKVFVDIGDEQSLEQSLSTFSAHMTNMADFLPQVDEQTLVLLDELGAGTDPVEGSALGIALLEYLKERESFVFATTHHTPIKVYALNSDYYTPASTLFDRESLKPLYRIIYGTVGESMALVVAQRCGVPEEVLSKAKEFLPAGFEEYFSARETLEEYIKEYRERLKEVEEERNRLESLILEQERKVEDMERRKREEIKRAVEEIKDKFEEFLLEAEKHMKSIRDKQRLRELFKERVEVLYQEESEESLQVGDWVEFMGSKGKVLELREGRANVLFGGVKAWVKVSELKRAEAPREERPYEKVFELKKSASSEINLTGFSVEEALTKLELFLQEAHSMGLKTVKVIHGYGAIKRAVQDFLSTSPLVVFHREGYPREGGAGTSLLYLSRD